MQISQRQPRHSVLRKVVAPMLAAAAVAITAQAAFATSGRLQPKPELKVEAERTPQGARLIFKGKNWTPKARIKITGTRAPGSSAPQDFGMFDADSAGMLTGRKIVGCTTPNMEDGQNETVTVTAYDSASTATKATAKVQGGAWVCL